MNNTKTTYKSFSAGLSLRRRLCYLFLILLTLFCLVPFYILIINATRTHSQIQVGFSAVPGTNFLKNFVNVWKSTDNMNVQRALLNSLIVSGLAAAFTTYFSAMTAFGLYMYRFKFRKFAFNFIMLVMMVPSQVSALGFIKLMRTFGFMDSFVPLVIPSIASPVVFFYMFQYMESTLPHAMVESARIDGANEFYSFNVIVLPIMKPAMAVQAIFSFVSSWNNYFMPALIIKSRNNKTIPLLIAELRSADYLKFDLGKVYMLICIAIVPLIIVYFFLSKYIIGGVTAGSVKG
ncbi:MAG: carbohydrate ABC transporter permease [Spirochaetaceae bacterium]|nr:carbohydrate ABC transporter permease [Spirochaetaceae bacterium]